jgi:uncharacterized membrane protein
MRAVLAALVLLAASASARADLEICNRTSVVIEAAIGVETKGAAATRGWFRVDPGACRSVLRGEVAADHLYLHARALALYGALRPLSAAQVNLCTSEGEFLIAGARKCTKAEEKLLPFAEVRPSKSGNNESIYVAESAGYEPEQARIAAIQRLLTLAGYDAEPIDGTLGAKSEAALAAFLKSKSMTAEAALRPDFLDLLILAAREGNAPGLVWCNDTKHVVMAAMATDEDGATVSRGWWRIEPGACLRPEMPRRRSGRVFSFAEAIDASSGVAIERKGRPLQWGGNEKFCVKNVRFEIRDHAHCDQRGLDTKGFQTLPLSSGEGAALRFREP